jgi:hypothetical protein
MPTKRSRHSRTTPTIAALSKRIVHLETALAKLTRDSVNDRRQHDGVVRIVARTMATAKPVNRCPRFNRPIEAPAQQLRADEHQGARWMLSWAERPAIGDTVLPDWSLRQISELDGSDRRAERVARGLNSVQLNWQPRHGAWSVGQCLEHLRVTNEVYIAAISAALDGRQCKTVDQVSLGWFSRWFIRTYIAPNPVGRRARAPKKIEPSKEVEPFVLEAFLRSNEAVRELVRRASDYDVNRIRFKNPFVPLLRFTTGTGLEIIAQHQSRHLLQAEGVRQSAGFPR